MEITWKVYYREAEIGCGVLQRHKRRWPESHAIILLQAAPCSRQQGAEALVTSFLFLCNLSPFQFSALRMPVLPYSTTSGQNIAQHVGNGPRFLVWGPHVTSELVSSHIQRGQIQHEGGRPRESVKEPCVLMTSFMTQRVQFSIRSGVLAVINRVISCNSSLS